MPKGKAKEERKVQVTPVRYRDVIVIKSGLEALASEIRLPLPTATRVARMLQVLTEAQEAYENERRKVFRDVKEKRITAEEGDTQFRKEGDRKINLRGSVPYRVFQDEVTRRENAGEPAPENMGNIIAALLPVLTGLPEEGDPEE